MPLKDAVTIEASKISSALSTLNETINKINQQNEADGTTTKASDKQDSINSLLAEMKSNVFGFDPTSLFWIIFLPIILQFYNVSVYYYVPIAVLFLGYLQTIKARVDRQAAIGIVTNPTLLKLIQTEMPSWFRDSDFQRVEWLNATVQKLWPSLAHAIDALVKETVQPTLDALKIPMLTSLKIKSASLGSVAPKFTGIRAYHSKENSMRLDIELKWAGDPRIALAIGTLAFPVPIQVELTDIRFTTTVRVELLELINKMPGFRALSVTLMSKPHIDFSLKVASLDIMSIGAGSDFNVTSLVQEIINSHLVPILLFPRKLVIPMQPNDDISGLAKVKPEGMLIVLLEKGVDLKAVNLLGGSDPYVEFTAKELAAPKKSMTIHGNVNPVWYQTFNFYVYDKTSDVIDLAIYDSDITNSMNTFLGRAQIQISEIKPNQRVPQDLVLKLTDTDRGEIHVSVILRELMTKKELDKLEASRLNSANPATAVLVDDEEMIFSDDLAVNQMDIVFPEASGDLNKNQIVLSQNEMKQSTERKTVSSSKLFTSRETNDLGDREDNFSVVSGMTSNTNYYGADASKKSSRATRRRSMEINRKDEFLKSVQSMVGILHITAIQLTDLKFLSSGSKSNPNDYSYLTSLVADNSLRLYTTFTVGNELKDTKPLKGNENPLFIEEFTFLISSINHDLKINVFNKVKYQFITSPKALGTFQIPVKELADPKHDGLSATSGETEDMFCEYTINGPHISATIKFLAHLSLFK
jgi:hypothetical protein